MQNIFITGYPRVGKTTLIKKILEEIEKKCAGFYTEEIRNEKGNRIGFKIITLEEKREGILAHEEGKRKERVGKYSVFVTEFEELIIDEMKKDAELIVIDEIGKMELLSKKFKEQLIVNLEKGNVIATITKKGGGKYVENLKKREDSKLYELTIENRDRMLDEILQEIEEI